MKKKILILGSTGMLGHQVFYNLNDVNHFDVYDLSFKNKLRPETIICNVTDFDRLYEIIQEIKPDIIVNCIGILLHGSKENPKNAILLNSYLPHWLADQTSAINSKLIHISTDCVFSGKKGSYSEDDFKDADDVYGRTKALGEVTSGNHLTIRTSIIGPELKKNGEGLFHWIMKQNGTVNGYTKTIWGGVTTLECSKAIIQAINKDLNGLINLTNGEKISKYELLRIIIYTFKKNVIIKKDDGKTIDKSLMTNRIDFKYNVPSYIEMINEMKNMMDTKKSIYSQYITS